MAPTYHQQIPEGYAFVEPRDVTTVRGLLTAAEALNIDPAVVRTQMGGYLAPSEVVELFLETSFDSAAESGTIVSTSEKSATLSEFGFVADGETGEGEESGEGELVAPKKTAAKPEWVAFAVAKSASTDEPLTEEQANELTTAQLIERFGASE